jgi:hypothetical protein
VSRPGGFVRERQHREGPARSRGGRSRPELPAAHVLVSGPLYYGWVHLALAALAMTATFPGRTNGLAMRSPAFWVLTLAASLFNMISSAFTFFSESILEAQGFGDKSTFTTLMAVLMASCLAANLLAGTRVHLGV